MVCLDSVWCSDAGLGLGVIKLGVGVVNFGAKLGAGVVKIVAGVGKIVKNRIMCGALALALALEWENWYLE